RETWDARLDGGAPDQEAVTVDGLAERRGVHDGRAPPRADHLQDLLPAFGHLSHLTHADPERADECGRAARCDELVPEPVEALDDRHDLLLVLIGDGDEHLAARDRGETGRDEALPQRWRERPIDAHD